MARNDMNILLHLTVLHIYLLSSQIPLSLLSPSYKSVLRLIVVSAKDTIRKEILLFYLMIFISFPNKLCICTNIYPPLLQYRVVGLIGKKEISKHKTTWFSLCIFNLQIIRHKGKYFHIVYCINIKFFIL